MAEVDGSWDTVTKSPMGDQKARLTIAANGNRFTGNFTGDLGSKDIEGAVEGNTVRWTMDVTTPLPVTLECEASADGDTLSGTVAVGAFGSFPMTGMRA